MEVTKNFQESSAKEWGTIREFQEFMGNKGTQLSRQRIWTLIQEGRLGECKLESTPRGNVWYISKPFEIETRHSTGGRPKSNWQEA